MPLGRVENASRRQGRRCLSAELSESFANGTNSVYVEMLYETWQEDPSSVHASWAAYFSQVEAGASPGSAFEEPPTRADARPSRPRGGGKGGPVNCPPQIAELIGSGPST